MPDAASGARAILGRSLEKINAGIRTAGFFDFLRFDSYDLGRFSEENPASAITGSEGADQGTPGDLKFGGGYKYDLTAGRNAFDLACMTGAPTAVDVLTATKSWRAKFRPRRTNAYRAAEFYVHEGGSFESAYQYGRRCRQLEYAEEANRRIKVSADYAGALGDTTAAFAVAKTGNTGTYTGKVGSRGRRPYDADYLAGKSVFLKVSAISGSSITFVAQIATAGNGLGGGFPVGAYGTATFIVKAPDDSIGHDGWTTVKIGTVTILGLGGENNEPFQVAFDGTLSNLAVGDEFEIPYQLGVLATTSTSESRFSAFHLERIIRVAGTDYTQKTSKGTLRLMRPYKEYYVNGQRFPQASDPSDVISAELVFTRRLFESLFRHYNDEGTRFSVYSKYQILSPITGTTDDHETVEIWMPRCVVATNKTGEVSTRETLEENPTMRAEQPLGTETLPAGVANLDSVDAWQCNITASVDLTPLA